MKKLIVFLFVLSSFSFVNAQTSFIIRGGLHSVLNAESEVNTNTVKGGRVGWNLGADVAIGNRIFVQPGIHYYSSSLSLSAGNTTVTDFTESSRIHSLKIPVMLGLSPFDREDADFAISLFGGVVPTINLGVLDDNDFIRNEDLTNFNFSGKLGIGTAIGPVLIGADYEFGLNKLFEDAEKNFSIIGLNLGFKF